MYNKYLLCLVGVNGYFSLFSLFEIFLSFFRIHVLGGFENHKFKMMKKLHCVISILRYCKLALTVKKNIFLNIYI